MNTEDAKKIDLLALFHFIFGGFMALTSCVPFVHVFMGLMLYNGALSENSVGSTAPDTAIGLMFIAIGSFAILLGWICSILIIVAGRKLKQRKNYTYCMVIAGISCLFMPLGTILGAFTLITLTKDSVKEAYNQQPNVC